MSGISMNIVEPGSVLEHPRVAPVVAAARRRTTPCGGGELVWHEWGTGATVVLLHGGFGSWLHWVENVSHLATWRRVLAVDLPGLGDSALPDEPTTPSGIAVPIVEGLRQLCDDAWPIDLVGFSFGGLIAGQIAAMLGAAIGSLTLVGASGLGLRRRRFELVRRTPEMDPQALREALRFNVGALMLHDPDRIDELAVAIQGYNDARARIRSRRMSMGDSLWQSLPLLQGQLSGIWGEHDSTATPWVDLRRAALRSVHPQMSFEVISGAGHWVQYEAPDHFNQTLTGLLRRHERQERSHSADSA